MVTHTKLLRKLRKPHLDTDVEPNIGCSEILTFNTWIVHIYVARYKWFLAFSTRLSSSWCEEFTRSPGKCNGIKGGSGCRFCCLCLSAWSSVSEVLDEEGNPVMICVMCKVSDMVPASNDDILGGVNRLAQRRANVRNNKISERCHCHILPMLCSCWAHRADCKAGPCYELWIALSTQLELHF